MRYGSELIKAAARGDQLTECERELLAITASRERALQSLSKKAEAGMIVTASAVIAMALLFPGPGEAAMPALLLGGVAGPLGLGFLRRRDARRLNEALRRAGQGPAEKEETKPA